MTDGGEHEELAPLFGSAWTLGDRVPAASLLSLPTSVAHGPCGFIVAGSDFGLGEPAAAAVAALQAAGIGAVICRSFSSRFEKSALNAGLPALLVEETAAVKQGDRLRIDIERQKVANLSSGDRYIIRNLSDEVIEILRAGGLRGLLATARQNRGRTGH